MITHTGIHTDLLIVGAGVVGLTHTFEALRRGLSVRVVERDAGPNGASIRNFGRACITAQNGDLLGIAYRSPRGRLRSAETIGSWAPEAGAGVARHESEPAVLEELRRKRDPGAVELVTGEVTADRLRSPGTDPDPGPAILGGALLPADHRRADRRVAAASGPDPRSLEHRPPGAADGVVPTTRGEFTAEHLLVCVGHDLDYPYPDVAEKYELQRSALQMAASRAPEGYVQAAVVLTGSSMTHHDGFTAMPSSPRCGRTSGRRPRSC